MRLFRNLGAILALAALVSCGQQAGPEDTLKAYLEATQYQRFDEAYGYVSSADKAVKTLAQYRMEMGKPIELVVVVAEQTKTAVVSTEVTGDTAACSVEITMPDYSGVMSEIMQAAFKSAFSEDASDSASGGEEFEQMLAEKTQSGELPTRTDRQDFTLVREAEGWRVFLDWETKGRVKSLMEEAEKLRSQGKLYAAKEKYDEVLTLDGAAVAAMKASEEVTTEISEFEEKMAYLPNVELYDFTAKTYERSFGSPTPGVEFKLRNNGDRTLNKVKVTVYFQDALGNTIAEEDFTPVLVSEYSFRDSKPLKPNYIWQLERGKFYVAESVPDEWKEGAATAKVTDIEFADQ